MEGEGGHRERHFSSVEGRASNTRPSHPARREEAESSCQWVEMHMSLEGCGQRPEPFLCCLPSQPLPWFQSFPGLESGTPQMDELAIGSPRPRHTLGPLPPWLFPFGPSIQLRLLCSCCPHPTGLNSVLGHSHVWKADDGYVPHLSKDTHSQMPQRLRPIYGVHKTSRIHTRMPGLEPLLKLGPPAALFPIPWAASFACSSYSRMPGQAGGDLFPELRSQLWGYWLALPAGSSQPGWGDQRKDNFQSGESG